MGIQGYLQDAFFDMVDKVVESVGDLPGVLGFEVSQDRGRSHLNVLGNDERADVQLMNEPHPGYIGSPSINEWASRISTTSAPILHSHTTSGAD